MRMVLMMWLLLAAAPAAAADTKACDSALDEVRKELEETRKELEKLKGAGKEVQPPPTGHGSCEDLSGLVEELKETRQELREVEEEGPSAAHEAKLQKLTIDSIGNRRPVFVQDALVSKGLQPSLAFFAYNGKLRNEWMLEPFLIWGPSDWFEIGGGIDAGFSDGTSVAFPVRLHAQGMLLQPKGNRPIISLDAEYTSPNHPDPQRLDALVLITQPVGSYRLHFNGGYEWVDKDSDRIFVGIAADRPLGDRTRAIVDLWGRPALHSSSYEAGGDLGGVVAITEHLGLQSSAGLFWEDGRVVPRLFAALIFES